MNHLGVDLCSLGALVLICFLLGKELHIVLFEQEHDCIHIGVCGQEQANIDICLPRVCNMCIANEKKYILAEYS